MEDIPPPQSSSHMPLSPSSELEARRYYYSLPSLPVLVARTGTPWEAPTGPGAWLIPKELRAVGNHALKEVWEDNLAIQVHAILDSMKVKWTSTDVVRLAISAESSSAPVILWIGVMPGSLSRADGIVVVSKCRELLEKHNIVDVDVEIRESVVTRSSGPKLLTPAGYFDPITDVHDPLTATLGLPICAQSTPWVEGTGGFFITEGGNTKRLLLVTARHVVFPPSESENKLFEYKNASQRRDTVTLFGDAAFNRYLESIQTDIRGNAIMVDYHERRIKAIEGEDNAEAVDARERYQDELNKANKATEALNALYQDVSTRWATPESRVLGHVILSPPINIGVGSDCYTEDWAVIEIDTSKVDASNFNGNAIHPGNHIEIGKLIRKMCPNRQSARSFLDSIDCLLQLEGTIPDNEMRNPTALDRNGRPCLPVIMRGGTSGLTVGRANNIVSYTRSYDGGDSAGTSKEWAILSYESQRRPFSAQGDSGSVIADGLGRIGGLLTGGAGTIDSLDVAYVTPISFILKRMQENGILEPNVNPVLTA